MKRVIESWRNFRQRHPDLLVGFCLLVLPAIFFWRETLGMMTLGEADIVFWFFPIWKTAAEQVLAGHLPLWNPYLYAGMPLFSQWQPGLLDPLNWLQLAGPTSATVTFAQEATFSIALLGTYGFARLLRLGRRAGVVSAVIFSLSGFAIARTIYPGFLHIFALTPWVFFFIERFYQRMRWRDAAFGALIVAWQLLAAHPQPFLYSALLAFFYVLFSASLRRRIGLDGEPLDGVDSIESFGRFRFLLQSAVMFLLGAALASVQLFPAVDIARQSVRQDVPFEFFTWHSLHPVSLLNTLFPFFHGQGNTIYQMPYWGAYWHHNEAQIYLGALALSLAIAGALFSWRDRSGVALFWTLAGLLGIALALGKYVGPLALVVYQIPMLGRFRSPNRHWIEVTLAVALLSGYAVERLLREPERAMALVARSAAVLLTTLTIVVAALGLLKNQRMETAIRSLPDMGFLPSGFLKEAGAEFYIPVVSALLLTTALFLFMRAGRRAEWYPVLIGVLIFDFYMYAIFAPISNTIKLESLIGKSMPPELAAKQKERDPLRFHLMLNPMEGSFNPYWFYGSEMATGYDPLLYTRYLAFSGINEAGRSTLPSLVETRDRTLDLLNVRYLLIPEKLLTPAKSTAGRVSYDGVEFGTDPALRAELQPGQAASYTGDAAAFDTIAVVSSLVNSADLVDGDEVAQITVRCDSGPQAILMLRAGIDTAEWAHDRPDVLASARHKRAPIATSYPGDGNASFQAHTYLARLPLPAPVAGCNSWRSVEIISRTRDQVRLDLKNLAFFNSQTRASAAFSRSDYAGIHDASRWRRSNVWETNLGYQDLAVYENLRSMPRVSLVEKVEPASESDQLRLIRGQSVEGREERFDPTKTALIDPDQTGAFHQDLQQRKTEGEKNDPKKDDDDELKISNRTPADLIVSAKPERRSLLVVSEIYFPGWRAKVDGVETPLHRVDYLLRGVELPPGKHKVEIFYWPRSLTIGAIVSGLAALTLLGLLIAGGRRRNRID